MPATTRKSRYQQQAQPIVIGQNEQGKLPPQAPELEEAVIGALMLEKEGFSLIADILRPESFYFDKHRYIFEAMQHLATREIPIDMLSVSEQLKQDGTFDNVGGIAALSLLTSKVATTAHLKYYAQIVAQKGIARDLIRISAEITNKAYDEQEDVEDLINEAGEKVFEISQRSMKRDVVQIDPVIKEAYARMEKAKSNRNNMSGVPTGYKDLDKITSGWQKSDLIIIAARPAMGKTAFVLSMAKNMALNFHQPVALFSLEMSNVQLVNRLIMNVCELDGDKIRNGRFTNEEWDRLEKNITLLMGAPIYVDDTPSLSIFELRNKARKLVKERQVQCIIIDYLQLMNASGMNFGSREQEVSTISRNLKALAKELDIPIIALSQLNRGVEGRTGIDGKKPQLSDLRESGAIEQDADMVCFIHRPEYYFRSSSTDITESDKATWRGKAQIIIAKHRNGATGEVTLEFEQAHARFLNIGEGKSFASNTDDSARLEPADKQQYNTYTSQLNANAANDVFNSNSVPDDGM
ncbi:MAG: replicative DNA helicase [Paludibacteraceae bacterium]|nr:replicative DNA helicase [Paludibacteraceae bacterium]MBR1787110.1 replicative DNA helicase [Paludibacteraceae bacterium]